MKHALEGKELSIYAHFCAEHFHVQTLSAIEA